MQHSMVGILSATQAVLAVALLVSTVQAWNRAKPSVMRSPLTDQQLPSLSVLVPAKDETLELENCLTTLIASDYPKLEIIALDDCSTNRRTPEIIRGFAHDGVRFIQGNEPPRTMLPKNHAYARLAQEASGELLLFIGVDVIVETDSLRRLVESFIADDQDMMSILPMRPVYEHRKLSFIQAMRYWWELGWPRRAFDRPPVLSTTWLIRASSLLQAGGFAAAAQMITPEAYFAKRLHSHGRYSFIRSTPHTVAVYSTKDIDRQFSTAVRVRYPQLHRRISIVALLSVFEIVFLIGPFVMLPIVLLGTHSYAIAVLNIIAIAALSSMYYLIAIRTHLNNIWLGFLTAPVAFALDIVIMHISMLTYEFGTVTWHDRRLNRPMLRVLPEMEK
jgi:chlorobactene glucosyltransferase